MKETVGIENLISIPYTTGSQLADNLRTHLQHYPIDLFEHRKVEKMEHTGKEKILSVTGGEKFVAPAIIIATGASWRRLNVPGETDYIGKGVAFCPHCDGPFIKENTWLSSEEVIQESKQRSIWREFVLK